ncbi:alkaline phosphatase family protein [Bradyrhizobium elkanii]|uniref:alkaline phosphatase family protein n=1 Tax=Bradyrhizobium elkanii TaxID=29448 RepID=UPI0020A181F5|nr:alkaline phosphatase family protein [Bradyrhizobium elkanii]MCP1975195.1 phospholipase C [Bradyrhizobium elkanii]MCS3522311.1 phospholipase C [Bradyrhizobium elkanii]MCS4069965.1 phospholipase C [Bradyrhizobium elkanii]MCS4076596.1 phospholipase C [Bradyrhizobium elkanii]MCS4112423.1 phospholipase C [Bradyrhizobium elkanii]
MRPWGAIPALAVVAGAVAISPVANAENLVEKIVDEFKHEIRDELRDLRDRGHEGVHQYKHIVVIYQENHSFDNLYGHWGDVGRDQINGISYADQAHTLQVRQDNQTVYACLLQNDVNLTSPSPQPTSCTDNTGTVAILSAFKNKPFEINEFIPTSATTCPKPLGAFAAHGFLNGTGAPGGCTADIVHRFYSEQYQLNGGRQNRYMTGSDAAGLVMGYYDTKKLPIYGYLHGHGAPNYIIADSFFQGAFGGSFLNHQFFVAAAAPQFVGALNDGSANDFHSIVDANGMPTSTPLYTPLSTVKDAQLTAKCNQAGLPAGLACGDYAINTTQPFYQPYSPGTADIKRLPPLHTPNIGDRLSAKRVDWAWYSGGWSNANGDVGASGWTNGNGTTCTDPNHVSTAVFPNCPDVDFQYHHQAFNYFANYAPGTQARKDHLKDEAEFIQAARTGRLKQVSFIKPIGEENEHPGYTSESEGSQHLVDLVKAIVEGPDGKDTLIVITYDEFGGQWDHVPPPPFNRHGAEAKAADQWGPGTRIPALLIAKRFNKSGVAHEDFDTTSILKMLEKRFDLDPLVTRPVRSLSAALKAGEGWH